MALLLGKGERLSDWREVDDFTASYQEAAIRLSAERSPDAIAAMLVVIQDSLGLLAEENRRFIEQTRQVGARLAEATNQELLRELLEDFYNQAYQHFRRFASVPAFFEAANAFLVSLVSMQVDRLRKESLRRLPPVAIMALGPAGRLEYTRFCRVQLALVWEGTGKAAEQRLMEEFSEQLVVWLRSCGVALDEAVAPIHPEWRGTFAQWRERLERGIARDDSAELIELLRLTDQAVLVDDQGVAGRFRALCSEQLHRRPAMVNLIERATTLSNGLGMMGGFRLTRSGLYRGTFALLNHALVPLAACVGALCLCHDIVEDGTPRRLRELVRSGRLSVDLAERALQAWQLFSHYRLTLELSASAGQDCRDILNLDLGELGPQEQEQLKSGLETVAELQRHLQVSFGQLQA